MNPQIWIPVSISNRNMTPWITFSVSNLHHAYLLATARQAFWGYDFPKTYRARADLDVWLLFRQYVEELFGQPGGWNSSFLEKVGCSRLFLAHRFGRHILETRLHLNSIKTNCFIAAARILKRPILVWKVSVLVSGTSNWIFQREWDNRLGLANWLHPIWKLTVWIYNIGTNRNKFFWYWTP